MLKKNILIVVEAIFIVILIIINIKSIKDIPDFSSTNSLGKIYEIERKWLISVENIPYDLNVRSNEIEHIEQTYINFSPEIRVRDVNYGQYYIMTMKGNSYFSKLVREEANYVISKEEYEGLLQKKVGNTIYKTRYSFYENGKRLEFDVFEGELEGLAYLEIEFESVEAANAFEEPYWIVKEVTDDMNYKNGYLARFGIPDSYYEYKNN